MTILSPEGIIRPPLLVEISPSGLMIPFLRLVEEGRSSANSHYFYYRILYIINL